MWIKLVRIEMCLLLLCVYGADLSAPYCQIKGEGSDLNGDLN